MPELPEVEAVRRELSPVVEGAHFARVLLRRSNLRRPFPPDFDRRLTGARVLRLTRRARYLLADLSSCETLVVHLGMSGWIRIEPAEHLAIPHDHVVIELSSGRSVVFNDPRRFGVMDLVPTIELGRWPAVAALGPEPLSDEFDAAALAAGCARRRIAIKIALIDQTVVAGLGNIYASEALHGARLSPRARASSIATAAGAPKPAGFRLAKAIKHVLTRAIDRSAGADTSSRFRVYDRAGERCPRRSCPGRIRRITQAGRSTFYCPVCQR